MRWAATFESVGVGSKGHVQGGLTRRDELVGEAIVNAVRCHVGNDDLSLTLAPQSRGLPFFFGPSYDRTLHLLWLDDG